MINLMLVEDHEVVREALMKFFNNEKDIVVVAALSNAPAAIAHLKADATVDVVIADWNMPQMTGLELCEYITDQFPLIKTMILTMHSRQDYRDKARVAGVKGFILKDGDFDYLISAVRDVANGKTVYTPGIDD